MREGVTVCLILLMAVIFMAMGRAGAFWFDRIAAVCSVVILLLVLLVVNGAFH